MEFQKSLLSELNDDPLIVEEFLRATRMELAKAKRKFGDEEED